VRHRLAGVLSWLPVQGAGWDSAQRAQWDALACDGEPWLGAEPALAELGYWMIAPGRSDDIRAAGCRWLAQFPSPETARQLAQVAVAPATSPEVRDPAIRALAARQVRARHPATLWSAEAVQIADEALARLAGDAAAAGRITSAALPHALRHVASEAIAAVFARAPGLWGDALECFATPPLARVLAVSIDDIPPQHRLRALRLVAASLGEEAVPVLLARASRVAVVEQREIRFLAITFRGDAQLGALEDTLRGVTGAERLRARARWHLEHPGVVPTVRGLRVARTTAMIPPGARAARCASAADDLAALTRYERHAEGYVYGLWGWLVRAAGDPGRARELVSAHPASQAVVGALWLEELARRGRVRSLVAAAHALGAADLGALELAIWGRPIAALELAEAARRHTPELACARALACYRAGRPDLADRILVDDLPPAAPTDDAVAPPFPGPDERWRLDHAAASPALAALVAGPRAIAGLAQPAPHDAEPDLPTIEPVLAVARRLTRDLAGKTVYLAGELAAARESQLAAAIAAAGGRVVLGPAPGTDYYIAGNGCSAAVIARLDRQGVRRLRAEDIAP